MSTPIQTRVRAVVCLSLAAAAGLHLAVLPDHVGEGVPVAAFFIVTAVLQFTAAALVSRGAGTRTAQMIAVGNVVVLGVWLISRTVGMPFGPEAGVPEPVSVLDALSAVAEVLAVGGLLLLLRSRQQVGERGVVEGGSATPGRSARRVGAMALTAFLFAGGGIAFAEPSHTHGESPNPSHAPGHTHPSGAHADHPCDLFHPCDK